MPPVLLKLIMSVVLLFLAMISVFTMFKVFRKGEKKYDIEKLKRIHAANGIIYISVFTLYSYLNRILAPEAEPSGIGLFNDIFAAAIIILLGLKITILRFYRHFYNQVKILGFSIVFLTFPIAGISGAYHYLLDQEQNKLLAVQAFGNENDAGSRISADTGNIEKGRNLFNTKCVFCHHPNSTETLVGPGLKGIVKNQALPASGLPATPDNIKRQLRLPFANMPSFAYLSEEEIADIIAFLNTL